MKKDLFYFLNLGLAAAKKEFKILDEKNNTALGLDLDLSSNGFDRLKLKKYLSITHEKRMFLNEKYTDAMVRIDRIISDFNEILYYEKRKRGDNAL